MALISLRSVSIQYGGPTLLDAISVNIEPGERACITGRNGEGKSTLLKILAGTVLPDSGEIVRQPGLRVAMLTQDVPGDSPGSVLEIAEQGLLPHPADTHHPGAAPLLTQLELDGSAPFNSLSGGMRRRVRLAQALAAEPDLLLLDEPTNHLDITTIEWLENYLHRSRCAALFVTHDRAFLKRVAQKVYDLDRGQLEGWNCDYPTFLQRKQYLLDDEAVYWERKSRKLAQEEAWIRRGVKARTTRNEGRVAALLKLRGEFSNRRTQQGVSRLQLDAPEASGTLAIKVRDLSFAYPQSAPIITNFSANILRGERIGIIGPNGCGKTTLLKLLCQHLCPTNGTVALGARVEVALFDQLHASLDLEQSIVRNLADDQEQVEIGGVRRHVYGYLNDFLFDSNRARTPVKALSGGERARLLLAKLFLQPGNLLVLDEPTNDLDIETLELLEEQLMNYSGTLLLASHDRTFLDNVVTSTLVLAGDGTVAHYPGGYADWLQQCPPTTARIPTKAAPTKAAPAKPRPSRTQPPTRLSFKDKRERETLPTTIDALEREIATLHTTLADPTLYQQNPTAIESARARLPQAEAELESAFERWAAIEQLAEELGV